MPGSRLKYFRQLTKLPSATADGDAQVGLGIRSSFTKPSLSGHYLYTGRWRQLILIEMKLENNWRYKSLENLEKDQWTMFDTDSRLVRRTKELRKIPLDNFTVEDLRLMIGQGFGLEYLIPLALEKLNADILAEGDLYSGDLLLAVVNSRQDYWDKSPDRKRELVDLIKKNRELISNEGLEIKID